ncbi:hypothetical protein GEV33_012519 [Tenebrio molitor]|uniref:Uncharacterized protein n=1 Tax=Tenebrio molitor TaxID=7067 RepID=A0A8J6HA54_TENMO|nr:hypothetical protein GEV33_012519 [Tenebrio molitor]
MDSGFRGVWELDLVYCWSRRGGTVTYGKSDPSWVSRRDRHCDGYCDVGRIWAVQEKGNLASAISSKSQPPVSAAHRRLKAVEGNPHKAHSKQNMPCGFQSLKNQQKPSPQLDQKAFALLQLFSTTYPRKPNSIQNTFVLTNFLSCVLDSQPNYKLRNWQVICKTPNTCSRLVFNFVKNFVFCNEDAKMRSAGNREDAAQCLQRFVHWECNNITSWGSRGLRLFHIGAHARPIGRLCHLFGPTGLDDRMQINTKTKPAPVGVVCTCHTSQTHDAHYQGPMDDGRYVIPPHPVVTADRIHSSLPAFGDDDDNGGGGDGD